jgi:SAM-dependent methyltransferase
MTVTATSATTMRVLPDDPEYRRMAAAEERFWASGKGLLERSQDGDGDSLIERHANRRFTGDEGTRWFETICRHGEFRRGLALGASGIKQEARILETNPSLHLTVLDISAGAIERRKRELAPLFPGRVEARVADLNFIDLEPESYDMIVSSSVLHHVINLEHVAEQVNRALTRDGLFFFHDYVGESRRRFSSVKKLVFELVHQREMMRQRRLPTPLEWITGDDGTSPLCGVRAADTLGVLAARLHAVEVRTAGALTFPMLFAREKGSMFGSGRVPPLMFRVRRRIRRTLGLERPGPAIRLNDAYVQDLLDTGDRLSDAGVLLPSNAFAIYRTRTEEE